jgi:hypothetical protein
VRRFVGVLVLVGVGSLGLGAAFVLAAFTSATGSIKICHQPPGQSTVWRLQEPDAASIYKGTAHGAENHPGDIIPPFVVIEPTTTLQYPGRNLNTIFAGGFTGAQIYANGCVLPPETNPTMTQTVTTIVTETQPVTVTAPGTTETLAGHTTTHEVTITVTTPSHTVTVPAETTTAPGQTVTVPGQSTVVTVPAYTTTTVTVVRSTDPVRTVTVAGQVVTTVHTYTERDPKTVILTVTATCHCVTGPGKG